MSANPVVKVDGLGKRFKIYAHPFDRAREWLLRRPCHAEFWALRDISFELRQGQILGILGPNGAGKSTLLKILTGTLCPTTGTYAIQGQALSLLSLYTGFNPELSGRENIDHSAQLLNLPQEYVRARLPEIEDFAELDEFFDRPVKLYSSGMRARLGFSMFAFLECSLLILDEVLAVGDIFFKQKCYARLEALIRQNTAIILVTHSPGVVQQYCHQAIFLEQGKVAFQGEPAETIRRYTHWKRKKDSPELSSHALKLEDDLSDLSQVGFSSDSPLYVTPPIGTSCSAPAWPPENTWLDLSKVIVTGKGRARCTFVAVCDENGQACQVFEQGQWLHLFAEFEILEDVGTPVCRYAIFDERNTLIHSCSTLQQGNPQGRPPPASLRQGQRLRFSRKIKLDLRPGEYILRINLGETAPQVYARAAGMRPGEIEGHTQILVQLERLFSFEITPRSRGVTLLHDGICNLPGASWLTTAPLDVDNERSNR
ncbi:MAG: ABC transporter ATP-binding protein [Chloroflexota bacterium]